MDDVTWVVEGVDVDDVVSKLEGMDVDDAVSKLERCAQARLEWADNNAVRFEESKTEAILFSNGEGIDSVDGRSGWGARTG